MRDSTQYATWLNLFSRSLLRDNKHAVEKEQVAKLVRTVIEVGTLRDSGARTGVIPLSETVMRAVIAVAEHADDPFRPIFIQTLAEIGIFFNLCSPNDDLFQLAVIDIDLAARTGAIRFLLHVLGEGPVEIARILASVFLHLVDCPRTRAYFQVGTDLEVLLQLLHSFCHVRLVFHSDSTLSNHGCLWKGARSCRPNERVCQGCSINAANMER